MATLRQVTNVIKKIAMAQPIVNSSYEGSIYDLNANPSNKYATVVITQQQHTETDNLFVYNFYVFYADRLVDDLEDNRLQVQSVGLQVLSNIFKTIEEDLDWVVTGRNYTTFEQRFTDELAGAYVSVRIETPRDSVCPEYYDEEDE